MNKLKKKLNKLWTGELASVILFCICYLAIIWQFLSLMFYGPFLLETELISEVTLSVIMLATMVFIGKEYYESYKNSLTL